MYKLVENHEMDMMFDLVDVPFEELESYDRIFDNCSRLSVHICLLRIMSDTKHLVICYDCLREKVSNWSNKSPTNRQIKVSDNSVIIRLKLKFVFLSTNIKSF